jgi:chemotaxis protein MotB
MVRIVRALGLIGLATVASCISPERYREATSANQVLREQMAELERVNLSFQKEVAQLGEEIDRLRPRALGASYIEEQKKELSRILAKLRAGSGTGNLPAGVEPVSISDGVALRVEGSVLFDSGSADLSANGKSTLKQLVETVRGHGGAVRISGHTDSDPIKHSSWKDNTRLSVGRALSVRDFLIGNGVEPDTLSVAGYGEFQPVDPADKARNRRVEIVLLR